MSPLSSSPFHTSMTRIATTSISIESDREEVHTINKIRDKYIGEKDAYRNILIGEERSEEGPRDRKQDNDRINNHKSNRNRIGDRNDNGNIERDMGEYQKKKVSDLSAIIVVGERRNNSTIVAINKKERGKENREIRFEEKNLFLAGDDNITECDGIGEEKEKEKKEEKMNIAVLENHVRAVKIIDGPRTRLTLEIPESYYLKSVRNSNENNVIINRNEIERQKEKEGEEEEEEEEVKKEKLMMIMKEEENETNEKFPSSQAPFSPLPVSGISKVSNPFNSPKLVSNKKRISTSTRNKINSNNKRDIQSNSNIEYNENHYLNDKIDDDYERGGK